MKYLTLLAALPLLALAACDDATTEDATCEPACGENQTCDATTNPDAPVCVCDDGWKMKSDNSGCVMTCPAEDPCIAAYEAAKCVQEGDTDPTCVCDDGFVYLTDAAKCVTLNTLLVVGTGGIDVQSPTEGVDVDAIGIDKAGTVTWCGAAGDVTVHNGPGGDVDADHRNKAAVTGAPDGVAATASTYYSLGLPTGEDKGWVSCKYNTFVATGDTVKVAEVTGATATDEPFALYACYQQLVDDKTTAEAVAPCVVITASQATGEADHKDNTKTYDFAITDAMIGATAPPALEPPAAQ